MRGLAILLACLPLAACSTTYDARISGPLERPRVEFLGQDGQPAPVCIERLIVREAGRELWAMEARTTDIRCALVDSVEYAVVPEGFTGPAAVPPAPEAGRSYEVFAHGWTRNGVPWGGGATAAFVGGRWQASP